MRSFDSRTKFKLELNKKYSLWEKSYTLMMWIRPTFTEMHLKDPASIMGLCSMGCWPEQNGPFVHFMFKGENLLHSHFGQGNTSSGIRFGNGEWMHVAPRLRSRPKECNIFMSTESRSQKEAP